MTYAPCEEGTTGKNPSKPKKVPLLPPNFRTLYVNGNASVFGTGESVDAPINSLKSIQNAALADMFTNNIAVHILDASNHGSFNIRDLKTDGDLKLDIYAPHATFENVDMSNQFVGEATILDKNHLVAHAIYGSLIMETGTSVECTYCYGRIQNDATFTFDGGAEPAGLVNAPVISFTQRTQPDGTFFVVRNMFFKAPIFAGSFDFTIPTTDPFGTNYRLYVEIGAVIGSSLSLASLLGTLPIRGSTKHFYLEGNIGRFHFPPPPVTIYLSKTIGNTLPFQINDIASLPTGQRTLDLVINNSEYVTNFLSITFERRPDIHTTGGFGDGLTHNIVASAHISSAVVADNVIAFGIVESNLRLTFTITQAMKDALAIPAMIGGTNIPDRAVNIDVKLNYQLAYKDGQRNVDVSDVIHTIFVRSN